MYWSIYIHTAFFQWKRHFFSAARTPTGSTFRSDSSVSVGPTVRTYTRNVPILRTFFITEFREPAAPQNLFKKTSKFSSGKVKVFQWKSQTFPVEKSNFSSGKAKLFQRKSQTGKCWDALTVLWRWRRLGWSRQLHTISTTSGRGGRPLDSSGSLRNQEVNFGFHWHGACGFGRARTCDEEAASYMVSRCAAAEG